MEKQIGEGPFSFPRYNMSLWTCIPNLKFLSLTVVEISLMKNLERRKKEQTQGRTNRRMPICNPTIQLVIVNLHTKYEISILNSCGDIFDEKVLRNYRRTDGTTDRYKPVYPSLFQSRGIIMNKICDEDQSGEYHVYDQLVTVQLRENASSI